MHGLESAFEGACLVAGSVAHSIRHSETRPAGERLSCGVRSSAYGRRMPGSYLISVCVCAHACVLLCTCVCACFVRGCLVLIVFGTELGDLILVEAAHRHTHNLKLHVRIPHVRIT